MYLYNVTIITESDICEDVRTHVKTQLLNDLDAGAPIFLLEMLDSPHEGTTYCIQLQVENKEDISLFQHQQLGPLQTLLTQKYAGKVFFFESVMQYLND